MPEPREVHPVTFFDKDNVAKFGDRDFSFTPEKVGNPKAGQPEPTHDPAKPPSGPVKTPVPAPDAEPIPSPSPERGAATSPDMAGASGPTGTSRSPVGASLAGAPPPTGDADPSTATKGQEQAAS